MIDNYGMTDYMKFIALSRYAKWLPEEKRRENFGETVERYLDNVVAPKIQGVMEDSSVLIEDIRNYLLSLGVMPSMRAMMTAGTAMERDNTCAYNCSYLPVDDPKAFDEAMFILMNGTGVGFSVERQFISKLPEVPEEIYESNDVLVVGDSKEAWSKAYRKLLALLWSGEIPKWDTSKVRPAGAKLKTFGGRASGPAPLVDLFNFTINIFKNAKGRKLSSLECHDIMCKIGEIVVVGGVRRSAMISLSNLSDDRMRHAKSGMWWEASGHRALANNSVAYTENPDMETFLREWSALVESKSGERGIFNRQASKLQAAKNGRRDPNHEFGTNPCLHPDSLVETVHGRMKIKDITEPTKVYTMDKEGKLSIRNCSASWISKKDAPTLNITIASGKVVRCTEDHKIFIDGRGWVEAKDIRLGDRVVHLVRNRRGAAYSGVKLTTQDKRDFFMEHRMVWEAVNGPIPDGYDVHHIDGDTYNNDVDNLECLSHSDHSTITREECANDHMVLGFREESPGRHGSLWGFVSQGGPKPKKIVPIPEELKSNLHQYATVVSMEQGEVTDVYDLTVEDTHNFIADFVVVHNCSEIILRPNQFCNLTEVVVRATDSLEDLENKVAIATILGTIQSTYTKFPYLRKVWKKNTEEERLLGVSLTGIMDNPLMTLDNPDLPGMLEGLRNIAVETNGYWADLLGVPRSTAITCVKPSGTVSQLVDSASGIHTRHAKHYIRTVRGDNKDPLTQFMKDRGIPNEPCVMKPDTTTVFSFPQASPKDAVVREDSNAVEQLKTWLMYQRHWCEHKPSVTINVNDDEWMDVGAFVYRNFSEMSGVSFLPYDGGTYQQAPYQECDEKTYLDALEIMPDSLDWSELSQYEQEDNTVSMQTMACSGDTCELVDLT